MNPSTLAKVKNPPTILYGGSKLSVASKIAPAIGVLMIQPTPSKTPSNPNAEVSFSNPRSTKDGPLEGG